MWTYKDTPKPWAEAHGKDEVDVIRSWFMKNLKVWDADICGDRTVIFVFDTGKYFRLVYAWWIEYNPEWELCEDIEIEEVQYSDDMHLTKDRDWLVV